MTTNVLTNVMPIEKRTLTTSMMMKFDRQDEYNRL